MCVENEGRPAAAALVDFVDAAVRAYSSGYSMSKVLLELDVSASLRSFFGTFYLVLFCYICLGG